MPVTVDAMPDPRQAPDAVSDIFRRSARLIFNRCTCCDVATRTLLLATDAWATVLYLGISD
jgi:hypothetical protein